MVSSLSASRLEKQLSYFYPRQHLSYVFEFRLSDKNDQVDLAIAFDQDKDIEFLKKQFPELYKSTEIQQWLDDCLKLKTNNSGIKSFWLEIDLDGCETNNLPSLFISLKSNATKTNELKRLVEVLSFENSDQTNSKLLETCKNSLDDNQYIEHIGVMHSRNNNKTTRLYIRGFNKSSLLSYLKKIQWTGNIELLNKHLEKHHSIEYISVALEFTDVWKSTIGIELHLKKETQHSNLILSSFVKRGIVSSTTSNTVEEILTPSKISTENCNYRRSLSHFKFTIKNNEEPEYKVYIQLIPSYTGLFGF